jgi:hypothetical protein
MAAVKSEENLKITNPIRNKTCCYHAQSRKDGFFIKLADFVLR